MSASRALYERTMADSQFFPAALPHPQWDDRHYIAQVLDLLAELHGRDLCAAELAELERVQERIAPPKLQVWRDAAAKVIQAAGAKTDAELGSAAKLVRALTGQPEQARPAAAPNAEGVRTTVLEPTEDQKRRIAEEAARRGLTPPAPAPLSSAELEADKSAAASELALEQERNRRLELELELERLRAAAPPPAPPPTVPENPEPPPAADSETTPLRNFTPPSR